MEGRGLTTHSLSALESGGEVAAVDLRVALSAIGKQCLSRLRSCGDLGIRRVSTHQDGKITAGKREIVAARALKRGTVSGVSGMTTQTQEHGRLL